MLGMSHDGGHLGKLFDGVADLFVEDAAIGDHEDRVEERGAIFLQPDELMCQPGDGVDSSRCPPSVG